MPNTLTDALFSGPGWAQITAEFDKRSREMLLPFSHAQAAAREYMPTIQPSFAADFFDSFRTAHDDLFEPIRAQLATMQKDHIDSLLGAFSMPIANQALDLIDISSVLPLISELGLSPLDVDAADEPPLGNATSPGEVAEMLTTPAGRQVALVALATLAVSILLVAGLTAGYAFASDDGRQILEFGVSALDAVTGLDALALTFLGAAGGWGAARLTTNGNS